MQSQVRVVGSNFSTFRWRGQPIAYLEEIVDSGVTPVARIETIHPLGSPYPTEFALPAALNGGTLTLTVKELWNKPVWQHLQGLSSSLNLLDVWNAISSDPTAITCETIIKPPGANYWRVKTYHNVIVTSIADGETISIGAMTVSRSIGCAYTHYTHAIVNAAS